jgi:hypothetical protein
MILGLDAWFNSNDHLPPHFHLEKRGKWEIRVYFLLSGKKMFDVKWGKGPTGSEKNFIEKKLQSVRSKLLEEWSVKVSTAERF